MKDFLSAYIIIFNIIIYNIITRYSIINDIFCVEIFSKDTHIAITRYFIINIVIKMFYVIIIYRRDFLIDSILLIKLLKLKSFLIKFNNFLNFKFIKYFDKC